MVGPLLEASGHATIVRGAPQKSTGGENARRRRKRVPKQPRRKVVDGLAASFKAVPAPYGASPVNNDKPRPLAFLLPQHLSAVARPYCVNTLCPFGEYACRIQQRNGLPTSRPRWTHKRLHAELDHAVVGVNAGYAVPAVNTVATDERRLAWTRRQTTRETRGYCAPHPKKRVVLAVVKPLAGKLPNLR